LTRPKGKKSFIEDDKGFRIGSEVRVRLEKSRFGTQGRKCNFKILWGEDIGIMDEESWFEAIKGSQHLSSAGSWYSLVMEDGTIKKFQPSKWMASLEDDKFRERVLQIMDEEIVQKFDQRVGSASDFYDSDETVKPNEAE